MKRRVRDGEGAATRGFPASMWEALRELGVRPRSLLPPVLLDLATTLLRLVTLAMWLPLIHGLLSGNLHFGRRLAFLKPLLPDGIPDEKRILLFGGVAAAILALTLVRSAAEVLGVRLRARLVATAEIRVGAALLDDHLRFGQSYYDAVAPKSTVSHLERLPRKVTRIVPWVLRGAGAVMELVLYATAMILLAREIAVVALAAMALYYGVFRRILDEAEARVAEEDDLEEAAAGEAHDLVANLLLAILNRSRQETVDEHRDRTRLRGEVSRRRQELLEIIDQSREALNVVMILAFILGAAWLVGDPGAGGVSRYVVFFFILRRSMSSFSNLQKLPRQWSNIRDQFAGLDRVLASGRASMVPSGNLRLDGAPRAVTVRDLSFAYPEGPMVLDQVALDLAAGRLNAVVGPNGSGKSTLIKLLLRLYDCPPQTVFIDDADIREFDLESLRRRTSFVGPEPMLLRGSIRDNLLFGLDPDRVTASSLARAVEECALGSVLHELPDGLDTGVGSGGSGLSRGQQQMVALARALLRDPQVLLLDEAISSLDGPSERTVVSTLDRLAESRLVVAVTHRVEALPGSASVTVLQRGRVVQAGSRRQLAATDGPFRALLGDPKDSEDTPRTLAVGEL